MELFKKYEETGASGLEEELVLDQPSYNEQKDLVDKLISLSKERKVRHDIEAQKVIARRLYELDEVKEASKICRKLLIKKPNDQEVQQLFTEIRAGKKAKIQPQVEEGASVLEKNKATFDLIEAGAKREVYGQDTLITKLSRLTQQSLLNTEHLYHYREAVILSSPPSQGVRTSLEHFFRLAKQYDILEEESVEVIDLAAYDADENMMLMFFVDIYNAFMGKSRVTLFKNIEQCPLDLLNHIHTIVNEGRVMLDGRYIYQNGGMTKINQSLVSGSFTSIDAKDQYLFFHSYHSLAKALSIFTASSQEKFSMKLELGAIDGESQGQLFFNMLNAELSRAEKQLATKLRYEEAALLPLVKHYFYEAGAIGFKRVIHQIYQKINQYFIHELSSRVNEVWHLDFRNEELLLTNHADAYPLLSLSKTSNVLEEMQEQIDGLIGLEEVKQSLEELKIYLDQRKKRLERGHVSEKLSVHFLFKGNPGTGKTTIARLVSRYLAAVGYLKEGHLIEVDRSDLVGQYIGHTAVKTMNKIKAAMGGVLFVDEAYSLARGGENDFGKEAIDTIVKAMEDYKDDIVIIFAGYPKEMDEFLDVNPGLKSRITQSFYFADYTTEQLVQIASGIASSHGYNLEQDAEEALAVYFEQHQIKGKTDGGNGRLARQTIENAMKKQSVRIAQEAVEGEAEDLLTLDDFGLEKQEEYDLEADLEKIIGLDHVKELVRKVYRQELINQKRRELNPNFSTDQSLNFIFTGNPGTGKTTIARIVADLLKNIGVLKKGHLVEVSRSDLVAGYIGQTATKTEKVFKEALGGVLFVDEAYALATGGENDFGKEAIDTLIKLIEDYREDVVVILAGYENDMAQLLNVNPGIESRFTNTLHFPDYAAEELYLIAEHLLEGKGFTLEEAAKEVFRKHIAGRIGNISGNGRYVRNVIEEVIRIQSDRLFETAMLDEKSLLTILAEDIEEYYEG